ncbi:membrane protein insertase YidC [Cellvibrio japonicus]|uniref:Membrane protein insertase YidC n=1 Tax=Cellvibrio japonicus (strain Ueda107) TaxID=498211 RepID=YIDC_CELJU|nr:membrane protein insertase YidC [Cellvibrio japonicus]B3PIU1.1 RecName: Full=Membrane protein insertase YidC; AltName: Full=Foldase YidC; AltName: Full=Membrane integrase YidC; AltName: Full=Membrane protein YidC [Cellvibrio japonicus Ueda107]ACE84210.1 inner membrane protein, 60 kDa [Cellvibrio japonicus Ueda107]QEI14002.1 membrane protein insertase YidC [Cellvibrio japonicus]QEI17576.1 membrane protein insertase YidC [Cellvibrio japonicus]QEI21152.1 membrane protein insertase YidC [Cellvi
MDWQKNLLLAAIAAVILMLFIRWNHFQEQLPQHQAGNTPAGSSIAAIAPDSNGDIPSAVPTASDTPQATADSSKVELIQVKTDNLLVTINPLGGDIASVSLPRHFAKLNTPDEPFVLLDNRNNHTYVSQSGLIGTNGTDTAQGRPLFNSSSTSYELKEGSDGLVVDLTLQQGAVNITKRFSFKRGDYLIGVEYLIDNQAETPWSAQLYGQIKRDSQNFVKVSALEMNPYLGAAITTSEENYKKIHFEDIAKQTFETSRQGGWVAMVQHYFISAWIPDASSQVNYKLRKLGDQDLYLLGFTTQPVVVEPGSKGVIKASFYAGPKDTERLEEISPYLDLTVDYGWLWWIAKPLFAFLKFIHGFLGNWGLAIIGLTLSVKLLFFPLSAASYRSMAKMRKLQPKLLELKERYGEDRQKFSQEMMKLYKTEQVNPFGGCLPLLIQMPVFIALYWVLMESVELRHAPFFGWIEDLSRMDPYFVLPIIYGATMWIMQKLNPQPTDPMQARIMNMLPFVFTFMFLWFPAGLVLYWVTNNLLSIAQQYVITRQIERADSKA